jgi:hypothetical protein
MTFKHFQMDQIPENIMTEHILESLADFKDDHSFLPATLHSLAVILITEIGDKTFFIAAVLAMRYGRLVVYSGAMGKAMIRVVWLHWALFICM